MLKVPRFHAVLKIHTVPTEEEGSTWLQLFFDLVYVAILVELGNQLASGASMDLPQLSRAMRMAHEGEFDILVTREIDRLAVASPSVAKKTNTPRAKGWNHAQIIRVVKNETYSGTWHYGKRNRKGRNPRDYQIAVEVPAIIDREVFEQAQLRRQNNKRLATRNTKREYLLARRCFCGECQASLLAFTKENRRRPYSYYRCPVPHSYGTHYMNKQCSMTKHFRADYWDDMVWQEIRAFLADPIRLTKGIKQYQAEKETINEPRKDRIAIIDRLLEEKKEELGRLLDLYLSGDFPQDVLTSARSDLRARTLPLSLNGRKRPLRLSKQSRTRRSMSCKFS